MRTDKTYIRFFEQLIEAEEYMRRLNRNFRQSAVNRDPFVVIDGPEDNYAVVDLSTAIDMSVPYSWAV